MRSSATSSGLRRVFQHGGKRTCRCKRGLSGSALLLAAGLSVAITSCSGDEASSGTATSGTSLVTTTSAPASTTTLFQLPSTTTTNPDDPLKTFATQDYPAVVSAALNPANPAHPGLARVATGPQLESWRRGLAAGQQRGESVRGLLEYRDAAVIERSQGTAKVRVCVKQQLIVYGPDGAILQAPGAPNSSVNVLDLVVEDARWKVIDTRNDGLACSS